MNRWRRGVSLTGFFFTSLLGALVSGLRFKLWFLIKPGVGDKKSVSKSSISFLVLHVNK